MKQTVRIPHSLKPRKRDAILKWIVMGPLLILLSPFLLFGSLVAAVGRIRDRMQGVDPWADISCIADEHLHKLKALPYEELLKCRESEPEGPFDFHRAENVGERGWIGICFAELWEGSSDDVAVVIQKNYKYTKMAFFAPYRHEVIGFKKRPDGTIVDLSDDDLSDWY